MPHRSFTDADGVPWQVWDVIPPDAERARGRRSGVDRRSHDVLLYKGPERRSGGDRRKAHTREVARRFGLTPGLEQGWLVCESPTEKRRVRPIPPRWEERSDTELERLCRSAMPARKISPS